MAGVLSIVAVLTTTLSGAARADTGFWYIETNTSHDIAKVLDVNAQDLPNHARIDQWEKNGGFNQTFSLRLVGRDASGHGGHNLYQIINLGSGLCMEVRGGGLADVTQVDQAVCGTNGSYPSEQLWNIKEIPLGTLQQGRFNILPYDGVLNNVALCMDVRGDSSDNGAQIIQYHCNNQDNQAFWSQPFNDLWIQAGSVNGGYI
jgi:hypothetical protein